MIVAAAVGLFAGLMGGRLGAKASTGFAKNLREKMFNHIQTFSFANIDKFSTAGLVTRMTTDIQNAQIFLGLLGNGTDPPKGRFGVLNVKGNFCHSSSCK